MRLTTRFYGICIAFMGTWGESAIYNYIYIIIRIKIIHKIVARVREKTGESRSTAFLIQRLAIDVQSVIPSSCARYLAEVVKLPIL